MSNFSCVRWCCMFIALVGFSFLLLAMVRIPVNSGGIQGMKAQEPLVVLISGGKFTMGNDKGAPEERPEHTVQLRPYYLAKYEVSNEEFVSFLNAVQAEVRDSGNVFYGDLKVAQLHCRHYCNEWEEEILYENGHFKVLPDRERNPVVLVTWFGAMSYARWLAKQTGRPYRLPTESEWEYAAGEGRKHLPWAGTSIAARLDAYANLCDASCAIPNWGTKKLHDGYPKTSPIGTFKPNALGLYDMTGNVHEWCGESYYVYTTRKEGSLEIPDPYLHTVRGGSWLNSPKGATVTARYTAKADYADVAIGFRLARDLER